MMVISRRKFLLGMGALAAVAALPGQGVALPASVRDDSRRLRFIHTHTGESGEFVYWRHGEYDPQALGAINRLLRDFRNDEMHPIDPALLDELVRLQRETGTHQPFEIISAYRSPQTNTMLASQTHGVARKSMHLEGRAIDIRLGDVPLEKLHRVALADQVGGVGYYPASDFVHVDTGPVRHWS